MLVTMSQREIDAHAPDVLLPPDSEFAAQYAADVLRGNEIAKQSSVAFVAICRNAMPWLTSTLAAIEETGSRFASWSCFIFENDSEDETKEVLSQWHDGEQRVVELTNNSRPHLNFTTEPVRTIALAEYRTRCQEYVRSIAPVDYVVVFDTDPWGGWSIDGMMTSLRHFETHPAASMFASYSWFRQHDVQRLALHYDAFAARLNHWERRDQNWFHWWHPPVGSRPVRFNSAFGQLAIYKREPYLAGVYTGEDCEHVTHCKTMPGEVWLNPSQRCVSFWVPDGAGGTDGGQHNEH